MAKDYRAKLVARKEISPNVYEATFEVLGETFSFEAGQYVWLFIDKLVKDDPTGSFRGFSLTSSPGAQTISIIFRGNDSGYKQTLINMKLGTDVTVAGPHGNSFVPKKMSRESWL